MTANGNRLSRAAADLAEQADNSGSHQAYLSIGGPVSVLMPVYNEADVIEQVIREWQTDVMAWLPAGSELLLDDGDSTDGTKAILTRLSIEFVNIRVLWSRREGFAMAARRLYGEARGDFLFFTDSDGQYVASEFWKVADLIGTADVAHGTKQNRQDPWLRLVASHWFNCLVRWYFRTRLNDVNSAFRLMRRSVIVELLPAVRHMPTLLNAELLLRAERAGMRIRQAPVQHRSRQHGVSRGLPPSRFMLECWRALRGLQALRNELVGKSRHGPSHTSRAFKVLR